MVELDQLNLLWCSYPYGSLIEAIIANKDLCLSLCQDCPNKGTICYTHTLALKGL